MPKVLTTNALIQCPHGGTGTSIPLVSPPKVLVQGGTMLLDGDQGLIANCGNQVVCAGYSLRSLGLNSTFLDGRRVMLVTDFIQSVTGFPLRIQEAHPLFDNTTPAPLRPGTVPELPPELREDDVPVAVVVPVSLPFSISSFGLTGVPPALPYVFTLQSQFPRAWTLWHIGPPAVSEDLTSSASPGISVIPSGGLWTTPTLTISLTLTGTFAATLAVGDHSFVLTAINHRGLSAMAEAKLVVSP